MLKKMYSNLSERDKIILKEEIRDMFNRGTQFAFNCQGNRELVDRMKRDAFDKMFEGVINSK